MIGVAFKTRERAVSLTARRAAVLDFPREESLGVGAGEDGSGVSEVGRFFDCLGVVSVLVTTG